MCGWREGGNWIRNRLEEKLPAGVRMRGRDEGLFTSTLYSRMFLAQNSKFFQKTSQMELAYRLGKTLTHAKERLPLGIDCVRRNTKWYSHFTGPKKLGNSRKKPPPTSPRNEYAVCTHPKHYARGCINHRCINS